MNSAAQNVCGTKHELYGATGYAPGDSSNQNKNLQDHMRQMQNEPVDSRLSLSCGTREHVYLVFCLGLFAVHCYFVWLTYLLYDRMESAAEKRRAGGKGGSFFGGGGGGGGDVQQLGTGIVGGGFHDDAPRPGGNTGTIVGGAGGQLVAGGFAEDNSSRGAQYGSVV